MRPTRLITAVPVAVVALFLATAAPTGALPTSGTGWQIFEETGTAQSFAVPAGVVGVTVVLAGAGGGEGFDAAGDGQAVAGAAGAGEVSDLATTPGSSLEVVVGGAGGDGTGGSGALPAELPASTGVGPARPTPTPASAAAAAVAPPRSDQPPARRPSPAPSSPVEGAGPAAAV